MTATIVDMNQELSELTALQKRATDTQREVRRRIQKLRKAGAPLKALSEAVNLSEAQVSRLTNQPALADTGLPALTAMELVRRAQQGEISHDDLVEWLMVWPYEPQYKTEGLADTGEFRDNSYDSVEAAYFRDVITDEDLQKITQHLFDTGQLPALLR